MYTARLSDHSPILFFYFIIIFPNPTTHYSTQSPPTTDPPLLTHVLYDDNYTVPRSDRKEMKRGMS
jgi:hypothetical protein